MIPLFKNNQNFLIVGDVHTHTDKYFEIIKNSENKPTIQIGDFGFKKSHEWFKKNIDPKSNKILFGNHDDTTYLKETYSLGNFSLLTEEIMCVRGAYSIDKYKRIEGIDWFSNEELNYKEMSDAVDLYEEVKPRIMITHDCPISLYEILFDINPNSINYNNSTAKSLQFMFDLHQPELWIFGHHHKSITKTVQKTKFICLNELETIEI